MNIHEIAEKYAIGLTKIKRMRRNGILICDAGEGHPLASAMRANLVRGQALSVAQMFVLIHDKSVFAELRTRQGEARAQIEALGDFASDAPESGLIPHFVDAAENDPVSVRAVINWIKQILPSDGSPVEHAWIAVRAAQSIKKDSARDEFLQKVARALHFCRLNSEFSGWHSTRQLNANSKRKIYFRPNAKNSLTDFDL